MPHINSLFSALMLLLCITAQAQMVRFNKTFGGPGEDQGRCAIQTLDKGYIAAGASSTYAFGGTDIWIVKTDSAGMHQWSKNYGGINSEWAWSVVQLPDSGYAVAGYTNSFGNGGYDMYLLRIDKSGNELWSKTFGGNDWDFAYAMITTNDGGFLLAGSTASFGAGNDDAYLVKTDASGDTLWTKTYGGTGDDVARSIFQNSDGGYFFNGSTTSWGNGGHDLYYVRTNAAGVPAWEKTLGGSRDEESFSGVQSAFDGGFLMVGYTKSFFFPDSIETGYLVRTAANGDTVYTHPVHTLLPGYTTKLYSIIEMPDYNIVMLGQWEYMGQTDVYFYMADPYYVFINSTTHGHYEESDAGYSVRLCSDGGYIIAGATESFGQGLNDLYLVKTDSMGLTSVYNSVSQIPVHTDKLLVIPNPVTDEGQIRLPQHVKATEIRIIISDITGRIVKNELLPVSEGRIIFKRDGMSSGAYSFILLNAKDKSIIGSGKILVR